jgi:hypothetical protein
MELIGDEKRIPALFSELRFADEQAAPGFTAVWNRAQSRAVKPRRAFNLSFVTATALLIFALASLAIWSRNSQPSEKTSAAFATVPATANFNPPKIKNGSQVTPPAPPVASIHLLAKSRAMKLAAQRQAVIVAASRKAAQDAKTIASWQSPTASLLSSSSDTLFKSLPLLNENANELKSFLPNPPNEKEK